MIEAKHPKLWRVIQAALTDSDKSYLIYMAVRLLEMRRLLKPTGSIYLHCDPTMSAYLKLLMDAILGRANYRNEIVWCYTGPGSPKMRQFNRKHDTIHWYSKGKKWTFNRDKVRISHKALNTNLKGAAIGSPLTPELKEAHLAKGKVPETWWPDFSPVGRLKNERVGYPTQKPISLLRRIIEASSNPGDMVLDPFAGCATACIAAEDLQRQWVGIDISPKAAELVRYRMGKELALMFQNVVERVDIPQRTDLGDIPFYRSKDNKKYLYGEQGGICNGCKGHFQIQNMTIDHIIPRSKGGTDHIENLQLLCGHCNSVKGNRAMEYLVAKLAA